MPDTILKLREANLKLLSKLQMKFEKHDYCDCLLGAPLKTEVIEDGS